MNVDALHHVHAAIRPPAQRVQHVVRVFGAEAGEDDPSLVGLAVALGIGEVNQLSAVGDIDAAIAGEQRRWE